MPPLSSDDRRRVSKLVEADSPDLAERLRDAIDETGQMANVAAMVAAQNELSKVATKAMELLERFIQVEERRAAAVASLLGPKGLIALVVTSLSAALSAWLAAGHPTPGP